MNDITNKMSGKTKEYAGKISDNKRMELKGKAQSKVADLQHKAKHILDEASHKLDH